MTSHAPTFEEFERQVREHRAARDAAVEARQRAALAPPAKPDPRLVTFREAEILAEEVGKRISGVVKEQKATIAALEGRVAELERALKLDDTLRSLASRLTALEEAAPGGSVVDARALLRRRA